MTSIEFKGLKVGSEVVIIQMGEYGVVTSINRTTDKIQVTARRHGMGIVHQWFNYTELARI